MSSIRCEPNELPPAEQDDGPLDHVQDWSRLLRTPPESEAAEEEPAQVAGIELPLESTEDASLEEGPLDSLGALGEVGVTLTELEAELDSSPSVEAPADWNAYAWANTQADELGDDEEVAPHEAVELDELPLDDDEGEELNTLEVGGDFDGLVGPTSDANVHDTPVPVAVAVALDLPAQLAPTDSLGPANLSRFHASFRAPLELTTAAVFRDGLLAANTHLVRLSADGTSEQLTRLPAPARQLLVHEAEGWVVVHTTDDRLFRVSEGVWQLQPLQLPRGLALSSTPTHGGHDLQLFCLDDQPKLLAGGTLWDLVGRATQLVPDPSVQRVLRISEPSGEFAICRTNAGTQLVHLFHNISNASALDWANPRTRLASANGRVATITARGELTLLDKPGDAGRRLAIPESVLALTMGSVAADTLVWLARQCANGDLELIEIDFATGSAARIFALPWRRDAAARLLWSANERVLYLLAQDELIALKRLEA